MKKFISRMGKDPDADRKINPTAIRTSEASQLQDADSDVKSRSPERRAYDEKTYEKAHEEIDDPSHHADQSGANPFREEAQKNL
jgi:hypothetical protein